MRLAIQIDQEVYEFYRQLNFSTILPFEQVQHQVLVFDTEADEWSWILKEELQFSSVDLYYGAPVKNR